MYSDMYIDVLMYSDVYIAVLIYSDVYTDDFCVDVQ